MGGFYKAQQLSLSFQTTSDPTQNNLGNNCSFQANIKVKKQDYDSFQRVPEPGEGRWKLLHFFHVELVQTSYLLLSILIRKNAV
jgi:hypothetical protein